MNNRFVGIGSWFVVSAMAAGCSQKNDKVEEVVSAAPAPTTVDFGGQKIEKDATWAFCGDSSAPSLEPLSEIASLKDLTLVKCGPFDLVPISHLHKLEKLNLEGAQDGSLPPLKSIDPIASLESLRVFKLAKINVGLEPLSGLKTLEEVWIDDSSFDRLEVMSGLVNLKRLRLRRTRVKDLTPISGLTQLEELELSSGRPKEGSLVSQGPPKGKCRLHPSYSPLIRAVPNDHAKAFE